MADSLLILNAGSSSIKYAVYRVENTELSLKTKGQIENIGGLGRFHAGDFSLDIPAANHAEALGYLKNWLLEQNDLGTLLGVGHRVTHGGASFSKPVLIDDEVLAQLRALNPLAPLHQPHNLSGIDAVRGAGDLPSVACFDTAFHTTQPEMVKRFALPEGLYQQGVRRYGFHGLSYDYISHYMARDLPERYKGKVLVAHLGNGASLCAMVNGRSLETSMGFSALDGLCMGTRCGRIDPGVLLYLMQSEGMNAQDLEDLLYRQSGLLGLSGISADMRQLLESAEPSAALAVDYFVHQLNREVGALAATMGGIDTLVFTGGIGENSRQVRARFAEQAQWLGIVFDAKANEKSASVISTPDSRVELRVIPTNEEHVIARQTLAVLQGHEPG
jgi:acetate kinase